MHFQNSPLVLLAFTTLSSAEQFPFADKLQGWLNQAQSVAQQYIPNSVPNPLHAGAAKVAENQVSQLTLQNWRSVLVPAGPSSGPFEPWMVYFTGGNRTCYGNCGQVDAKWNVCILIVYKHGQCTEQPFLCRNLPPSSLPCRTRLTSPS